MSARQGDLARRVEQNTAAVRDQPGPEQQVRDAIKRRLPTIKALLPDVLDERKLAALVITEVYKTPALAACTEESLIGCVLRAAALGLQFGQDLGEAFLIPRGRDCTLQIGYKGVIRLAMRSERIRSITTRAVYEGDRFEFAYGLDEKLIHEPPPAEDRTAGMVTHAYAVVHYTNGGRDWEVLDRAQILARKARGKGNQPAWQTDFAKMAEKSAILAMRARLPLTTEVAEAFAQDGQALPATHGPAALEAHHSDPEAPTGEIPPGARDESPPPGPTSTTDDAAADPEPEHAGSPIGATAGATVHKDLARAKVPTELHAAVIAQASRGSTVHASELNPSRAALAVNTLAGDCVADPALFAATVLGGWNPAFEPEARAALAAWLEAQA